MQVVAPAAAARVAWALLATLLSCTVFPTLGLAEQVSFRGDVMAVLSKAGCNQGTCHGNQNGKGGFRLSLRGQDPTFDLRALGRDQFGRRIDRLQPDESLILKKATMQVAHEGGRRFGKDSLEYDILKSWITGGGKGDKPELARPESIEVTPTEQVLVEPQEQLQLNVRVKFSDGSVRDVSRLAVYETSNKLASVSHDGLVQRDDDGETTVLVRYLQLQVPVRLAFVPARPGFAWHDVPAANFPVASFIDDLVAAKLKKLRMNPADVCSDVVFLRRAYLDLLGVLPTADEAQTFLADAHADKRARLIDQLLEREEFADFWALKWSDLLRNEEKTLDRKGVQNFHHWIRNSVASGEPVDQFVRELVSARGSSYQNPAANYYRANRDPISRAEATAQVFLGIRLQCAKCHNHPFDRWTQEDYYRWAACFARVRYKIVEIRRRDELDQHEFDGEQVIWMARAGTMKMPDNKSIAEPRFLGSSPDALGEQQDPLEELARWLTGSDNAYFARSQANRVWFHLLGRGIVEPIDDFRATNPASNPALLDALAQDFVAHRFDLRHLIRRIMNSRTYQRSAAANETNEDDESNFSHALIRPLTAEQLLDALNRVTGASLKFSGYPQGMRAGQLPGVLVRGRKTREEDRFLGLFGKPARLLTCECERGGEPTLGQAFQLISGPTINNLLRQSDNRLARLLDSGKTDVEIVDDFYWTALSRAPADEERKAAVGMLAKAKNRRMALEDIVWALVNAKEFVLRQ
jgi:hypothetical protein